MKQRLEEKEDQQGVFSFNRNSSNTDRGFNFTFHEVTDDTPTIDIIETLPSSETKYKNITGPAIGTTVEVIGNGTITITLPGKGTIITEEGSSEN